MKKIFLAVVVALFSLNTMAQHEIGGIVGGLMGASYKYWFNDAMALQADLAVGLTEAAGSAGSGGQYDFTINPNFEYHWNLPVDNLKIFAGGGINFGLCGAINAPAMAGNNVLGKFGINAISGLQYDLSNVPLALAFDFRPGYGCSFRGGNTAHFFDWKIAGAGRYRV